MGGDAYYFGDNVNMHGGTGNIGMVNQPSGPVGHRITPPALEESVRELRALLEELRGRVGPAAAQSIDACLPALVADPGADPQERHRALMAVTGIAAIAGAVGQPVIDAVQIVLRLLGG